MLRSCCLSSGCLAGGFYWPCLLNESVDNWVMGDCVGVMKLLLLFPGLVGL
jgi:hypothetical protein